MAGQITSAPVRREQTSFAQRLRGLWRRIEPGFISGDDSNIERWDACGEGPAACYAFEGFGLSFSLFIGRTPRFDPDRDDQRTHELTRFYAGEKL